MRTAVILSFLLLACGPGSTGAGDGDGDQDGDGSGDGSGDGAGGGGGGGGDDPGFGAENECYGVADDLGEVFSIDRATGQATHLCSVPGEVAEIDAISSHPVTGVYYYVSQKQAELGWFSPDACEFHTIGAIDVQDLAGLTFHPETAVLYAGDQEGDKLYRFAQDDAGVPAPEMTLVADLPVTPKAIAIEPQTNRVFVSDAESLFVVDLENGETVASHTMTSDSVEALFFTVDGALHGVVEQGGDPPNRFVDVDPATGAVTDVGGLNPVNYRPGSVARPEADDVEAMECNVGGACTSCGVD